MAVTTHSWQRVDTKRGRVEVVAFEQGDDLAADLGLGFEQQFGFNSPDGGTTLNPPPVDPTPNPPGSAPVGP